MVAGRFLWVFKVSSWQEKICLWGPATLEHQEYGQTNAVFEKVKVSRTFLSFHLLSHTEAGHMSPILAEFRGGRGVVALVVRGGAGMLKSIRTHRNSNVR